MALIIAPTLTAVLMVIAAPAQAHEPYIAKAWGSNHTGQLGDGMTTGPEKCTQEQFGCSTTPVQVSGLSGVTAVSAGRNSSLALLENGTVMGWGEDESGQLGDGTTTNKTVPVAVKELSGVKAIVAGFKHGLALLENGTVMAWGKNSVGALGDGTTTNKTVPVAVKELSGVKAIAAGEDQSLALLENGTVMAWGGNGFGQLGDGTTTQREVPVAVSGLGEKVKAIAAGESYSLALLENGTVMAWGSNGSGQLGNGGETNSHVPVAVSGLTHVSGISAVGRHALAVLENGDVMAWGLNNSGQLGDGTHEGPETCGTLPLTFACAKKPVPVSLSAGVIAAAAGREHSLALFSTGTVAAWGHNNFGQLGDGTSLGPEPCGIQGSCSSTPVAAGSLAGMKGIAGGGEHSLAFGPPPPTVTTISPKEGAKTGGTRVTITGTELEEGEVRFGSAKATNVTVKAEGTTIEATAPAGTGIVDVTVTTPAGTSLTSSADQFNYSRPKVKKISPKKGPAAGGTSVTITGENFTGATNVKFGANSATEVKVRSDSMITCASPASTTKKVFVTVTTPNGTSATSGKGIKDTFIYRLR